jgi:hypothetical protein
LYAQLTSIELEYCPLETSQALIAAQLFSSAITVANVVVVPQSHASLEAR